jgi:hypothetical protein
MGWVCQKSTATVDLLHIGGKNAVVHKERHGAPMVGEDAECDISLRVGTARHRRAVR